MAIVTASWLLWSFLNRMPFTIRSKQLLLKCIINLQIASRRRVQRRWLLLQLNLNVAQHGSLKPQAVYDLSRLWNHVHNTTNCIYWPSCMPCWTETRDEGRDTLTPELHKMQLKARADFVNSWKTASKMKQTSVRTVKETENQTSWGESIIRKNSTMRKTRQTHWRKLRKEPEWVDRKCALRITDC